MDRTERIAAWLAEDLGSGDITAQATVPEASTAVGVMRAKAPGVIAGVAWAVDVFRHLGLEVADALADGTPVKAGDEVMTVRGSSRDLLAGERLALNMVMRCSGIATATRRVVDAVAAVNPKAKVLATRKTTPGWRDVEHEAVVAGGGSPHRSRLDEAFLVKENHLRTGLGITQAVKACRAFRKDVMLLVEAETTEEALAAVRAGADGVLLDDFTPEAAAATADLLKNLRPEVVIEVSGGLTLATVASFAASADRLSLGALTHSVQALDVAFDIRAGAP